MKYEKIFLSITFTLAYFISIVAFFKGAIGALIFVMMVPAFAAIISILIEFKSLKALFKPFFYKISFKSLVFAILYPLIIIFFCGFLAVYTDKGVLSQDWHYALLNIAKLTLISIVLFSGGLFEEYGWRGYLLPRFIKKYNTTKANLIVGGIIVIYNLPSLVILNLHNGIHKTIIYVSIQCFAIFALNYAFTYLYTLSKNVILPSIMHILWNNINSAVLGDTFRHCSNGLIKGDVQIFNGQYILGLIFLSIFAICAQIKFSRIVI